MRLSFRFAFSLIIFSFMTACDAIPNLSPQTSPDSTEMVAAEVGLTPQETVESFLRAWNAEEFATMYSLLHPRSAEVYSIDDFRDLYSSTHSNVGFTGVSYDINDVNIQGMSAAVLYDVVLDTATFGTIDDYDRTMRLVENNGGWTIAWSPMDVINGMTANVRLDPSRRFAPRGNIYDRTGQFLVNQNGTTYSLVMRLSDMRGEDECTALLSRVLLRPISYFTNLYVDYRAADSAFFVGEIDSETYEIYRNDLDRICGTDIEVEFIGSKIQPRTGRTYFGHGAAAHITGYVSPVPADNVDYWRGRDYSDRDWVGSTGVEFALQDELAGVPDQSLRLIDSSGVILRELGSATGSDPTSVTLTIDRDLQWDTAQAFIDAWNYAGNNWATVATGGAAVVMDVNTGAILSMFSFPTYDPAIFFPESNYYFTNTTKAAAGQQINNAINNDRFLAVGPATHNRAFTQQYAPGSVFKILSTLAAADSEVWAPDQIFECDLTWDGSQWGDTAGVREDWRVVEDREAAGPITMIQALTTSCNPFFWRVGVLMYEEDTSLLYDYATSWGFGQPTRLRGLQAETEATGFIPQPDSVTAALNDVIGQGNTAVTAIQMVRLVAAIANGGTLYQPYLVQQVGGTGGDDVLETFEPVVVGQLNVSDTALATVREGMCNVPIDSTYGTAVFVFADHPRTAPTYTSCGKTGTAEASIAPNAWYVTYAPADNPQIAIAVVVPQSREGSEVSAPIARRIMDHYFGAPIADFPDWWNDLEYIPIDPPRGVGQ